MRFYVEFFVSKVATHRAVATTSIDIINLLRAHARATTAGEALRSKQTTIGAVSRTTALRLELRVSEEAHSLIGCHELAAIGLMRLLAPRNSRPSGLCLRVPASLNTIAHLVINGRTHNG